MKKFTLFLFVLILFAACIPQQFVTVDLFYYNPELDMDENGNILCTNQGLVAVERELQSQEDVIETTISLLLEGKLASEELESGVTTEFPLEGFGLNEAVLEDAVLTLKFDDPLGKTQGGACRVMVLWAQIEATAKQFPEVEEVRFEPDTLFQP